MTRLTTDLIGKVFNENQHCYLITDRTATKPGFGVVRKLSGKSKLIEMPVGEIEERVHQG